MEQSKNTEAMAVYERSLALQRHADGSRGRDTCETRIRLARLYADAGRRDEAAQIAEETLTLARAEPVDEAVYRRVLIDYADTQYALGNTERQMWANGEALTITTRVYGPDSTETMRVENNFATALNEMGRARDAIPHIENVVKVSRATGLSESPDFAVSLSNLGAILESVGEYERAEAAAREALAIVSHHSRDEAVMISMPGYNLARILTFRHQIPEALRLLNAEVPAGLEGGTAALQRARRDKLLGDAYVEARQFDLAARAYDAADAGFRAIESEAGTEAIVYARGRLLHAQGRDAEALPLLREAVADYAKGAAPSATYVLDAKAALADVLFAVGHREAAVALAREIAKDVTREVAPQHRARLTVERLLQA
jgi:serine/threonine-protein kinase